jgi:hypothetical protein
MVQGLRDTAHTATAATKSVHAQTVHGLRDAVLTSATAKRLQASTIRGLADAAQKELAAAKRGQAPTVEELRDAAVHTTPPHSVCKPRR